MNTKTIDEIDYEILTRVDKSHTDYHETIISMRLRLTDKAAKAIEALITEARKDEVMLSSRMAQASSGDLLLENINNRLAQLEEEEVVMTTKTIDEMKRELGFNIGHWHYLDDDAREEAFIRFWSGVEALIAEARADERQIRTAIKEIGGSDE